MAPVSARVDLFDHHAIVPGKNGRYVSIDAVGDSARTARARFLRGRGRCDSGAGAPDVAGVRSRAARIAERARENSARHCARRIRNLFFTRRRSVAARSQHRRGRTQARWARPIAGRAREFPTPSSVERSEENGFQEELGNLQRRNGRRGRRRDFLPGRIHLPRRDALRGPRYPGAAAPTRDRARTSRWASTRRWFIRSSTSKCVKPSPVSRRRARADRGQSAQNRSARRRAPGPRELRSSGPCYRALWTKGRRRPAPRWAPRDRQAARDSRLPREATAPSRLRGRGVVRKESNTDFYPPTQEIYEVPPGFDAALLPPLPEETDPDAPAPSTARREDHRGSHRLRRVGRRAERARARKSRSFSSTLPARTLRRPRKPARRRKMWLRRR